MTANAALYDLVGQEAFFHLLLPFREELIGDAMGLFGGYDMQLASIYAFFGGALAFAILFIAGRFAAPPVARWQGARYDKLQKDLRWILPIGAFAILSPFGFAIAIALGLFRSPMWLVVPIALLSIWYGYYGPWVAQV